MPSHVDIGGYLSGDPAFPSNDSGDTFAGQGGASCNPNQILTLRLPRTVAEALAAHRYQQFVFFLWGWLEMTFGLDGWPVWTA